MRAGEPLDSQIQCTLTPGTIVEVSEVRGRHVEFSGHFYIFCCFFNKIRRLFFHFCGGFCVLMSLCICLTYLGFISTKMAVRVLSYCCPY